MNVNDLFRASFGQYGSVYLTGDGAQLDLNGATANRFIIAIINLLAVDPFKSNLAPLPFKYTEPNCPKEALNKSFTFIV